MGPVWRRFTQADGLGDDQVNEIYIDPSGAPWFATQGGGASTFDGTTWSSLTTADGLIDDKVTLTLRTSSGELWFATESAGLSRFDGQSWTSYTIVDGLPSLVAAVLYEDGSGRLWAGRRPARVSSTEQAGLRSASVTVLRTTPSVVLPKTRAVSSGSVTLFHYREQHGMTAPPSRCSRRRTGSQRTTSHSSFWMTSVTYGWHQPRRRHAL